MFVFLNKEKTRAIKRVRKAAGSSFLLKSKKGQAAAVLLTIVAVGLILYAVSLNFGRVSQHKTLTIRAANASAAMMASMMASYGESVFRTTLGGRAKHCDSSGLVGVILTLVIVIIAIVIAIFTPGTGAAVVLASGWVIAALVMAVLNVILHMAVVEPGITAMWHEMISESMTIEGQIIERGIMAGLQNVVTDQVRIPDEFDQDGDGIFGPMTEVTNPYSTPDRISRFSHYYTRRLQGVVSPGGINLTDIQNFKDALEDFLYASPGNPGMYDPVDCPTPGFDDCNAHPCCGYARDCTLGLPGVRLEIPAFCDPCCLGQFQTDAQGDVVSYCAEYDENNPPGCLETVPVSCDCLILVNVPLRPTCCDDPDESCSFTTNGPNTCAARSPYSDSPGIENYPYVYDYFYEDATNNLDLINPVISYVESIGRDDEHRYYNVNRLRPQWHTNSASDSQVLMGPLPPATLTGRFRGVDSTDFYPPATSPPPIIGYDGEDQVGIYPHFYALADLGTDLSALTYLGDQRHWCDQRATGGVAPPFTLPSTGETQLVLPGNFDGTLGDPYTQSSWCVDNANVAWGLGTATLVADIVPLPGYILTNFGTCAFPTAPGTWKRGLDLFCSERFPYFAHCPDKGWDPVAGTSACDFDVSGDPFDVDCECTEAANPTLYTGDYLDRFRYEMKHFLAWAEAVIDIPNIDIRTNFLNWYDHPDSDEDFMSWFDPANGRFNEFLGDLDNYINNIDDWLDGTLANDYLVGTTHGGTNEAWCIPDAITPCAVDGEYLDGVGNDVDGMDGVLQCLDFNVNDTVTYPISGVTVIGNAQKFDRCAIDCTAEHCQDLPRAVDPDYCANWDFYSPIPEYDLLQLCLASRPVPPPPANGNIIVPPAGTSSGISFVDCDEYCDIPLITGGLITGNQTPPQTAAINPPFVSANENLTYTCLVENSCDPAGAFMTTVNAAIALIDDPSPAGCMDPINFPNSDCATHRPAFAACQATAGMCGAAYPATSGDISVYQPCSTSCTGLPTDWNHDLGTVSYGLPAFTGLSVNYNVDAINSCGISLPGPDDDFFDDVAAAVAVAGSSCDDPNYAAAVADSAEEASIQVAKFGKRLEFLQNRRDEAVAARAVLTTVRTAIFDFTDPAGSPVQDMIDASGALSVAIDTGATSSVVVYAWQDKKRDTPRKDTGSFQGYWHIVKVETRAPKRCLNYCGVGGTQDPEFPWVDTYTRSMGTTRCYELMARQGMVKSRVIRFDEDAARSQLTFPDGTPIWHFRFWHPGRGPSPNPSSLDLDCEVYVDPVVKKYDDDPTPGTDYYYNKAFMINEIPAEYVNCINSGAQCNHAKAECWSAVHGFLTHGVSTVQCAVYEFNTMFSIRFVPCDDAFKDGEVMVQPPAPPTP